MIKKETLRYAAAGLMIFTLFFGGALAYMRSQDTAKNTFGTGENKINIVEEFEPPKETVPGVTAFKKRITVDNTGDTDAFIRVFVDFSSLEALNHSFVAQTAPRNVNKNLGKYEEGMTDEEKEAAVSAAESAILTAGYVRCEDFWKEGGPARGWVYIPESEEEPELGGYFYYTESVAPGRSTNDLIHSICTYYPDTTEIKPYQIFVYAESVQVLDKDGVRFEDSEWREAWDEFTSRKNPEPTSNTTP